MKEAFLQQTARSIIQTIDWKQLSRTTLVLPSHRAGLVLKDELLRLQQEQHAQAIWAPRVQTLTQLQDELSPLYAEDELFTIVRLYKLYRESGLRSQEADLMPLDLFYGWGRQMLADFTNIDASMPATEVPNFFENTIAAHELERWQFDEETEERLRSLMNGERSAVSADKDSVRNQYEQLWQQLYTLYIGLREEMAAEQKGYAGMRQRAVIEHWENEEIQAKIAGRTYIFVGFNYLLPVERELMLLLRDAGQARFFWDYVPNFKTNEKAFSFARKNAEILGSETLDRSAARSEKIPVTVVECVSREAQAQYVHRWLQENYTAKGQKVGIVICDETMLEPVIYTLPAVTLPGDKEPEPVNITKGFPLRNTAIYSRVTGWLNDNARGRADEPVTPEFIDDLLRALFQENQESPSPITPNPLTSNPLTWQELLILESEYQVRKIVNQMRLLLAGGLGEIPFTLKLLRLLMRRMMESVTMPFHGEPVTDIQVMGVLETRLLDFDKLLLLNVEEGVVPQSQHDLSFIPFYLRKTYHMQTSDEKATIYAYNFFRLLSRAGHSTLLYATAETAEGGRGMSRFIMQILYSDEFEVSRAILQEKSLVSDSYEMNLPARNMLSTLVKDEQGVLRKPEGKRYCLSPSALNTYITCPRSFYLRYIEGLKPKEDEDVLFASNTMGSFVHHAVEYVYSHFLGCDSLQPVRIKADDIEAVRTDETKMQEALMAAYREMNQLYAEEHPEEPNHYIPENHSGENIIIKGYVSNILERDREDAKTGLQICLLEQARFFSVKIEGVGELLTGGIIDRLDIVGSGNQETLRVVDYKSGSYNDNTHVKKMSSLWEDLMANEDKGYVRQTLIYSHAVIPDNERNLPIEPNLYFCRHKLTELVTTVDVENETVSDYRQIQKPFYEALKTKIQEIVTTTEFPQCEPDKCPSFCPFFALCGRKKSEY